MVFMPNWNKINNNCNNNNRWTEAAGDKAAAAALSSVQESFQNQSRFRMSE